MAKSRQRFKTRVPKREYMLDISVCIDDDTGLPLSMYFQIRDGKVDNVLEHCEGNAFANYDKHGKLLGIELLAPCEVKALDKIVVEEPTIGRNRIKKFFRTAGPRELVEV